MIGRFISPAAVLAAAGLWGGALYAETVTAPMITGIWLDQDQAGYIQITEVADDHWQGRIVGSVKGAVEDDVRNPDPALRSRSLLGQPILKQLRYEDDVWAGLIYNPRDGGTYSARLRMLGPDSLEVRGFIGLPMLGQSQVWTRVTDRDAPGLREESLR